MAPGRRGFENVLDSGATLQIACHDVGGPQFMVSLHGKLMMVAGVAVRARGRARTIGSALQSLWEQIEGARLVPEQLNFEDKQS